MYFTDDVTLSVNFVDERLLIQGMRSFNLLPLAEKKKTNVLTNLDFPCHMSRSRLKIYCIEI